MQVRKQSNGTLPVTVVSIHLSPWLIAKLLPNGGFKIIHQQDISSSSVVLSCVRATWLWTWELCQKRRAVPNPARPFPKPPFCPLLKLCLLRWSGAVSPPPIIAWGPVGIFTWTLSQQQCLTLRNVPLKYSCFPSSLAHFRSAHFQPIAAKFWKAQTPGPVEGQAQCEAVQRQCSSLFSSLFSDFWLQRGWLVHAAHRPLHPAWGHGWTRAWGASIWPGAYDHFFSVMS